MIRLAQDVETLHELDAILDARRDLSDRGDLPDLSAFAAQFYAIPPVPMRLLRIYSFTDPDYGADLAWDVGVLGRARQIVAIRPHRDVHGVIAGVELHVVVHEGPR